MGYNMEHFTIEISRGIEGLWFIIEHETAIEHVKIFYQDNIGYFVITDQDAIMASKSLKNLWRARRHIGNMIIEDLA